MKKYLKAFITLIDGGFLSKKQTDMLKKELCNHSKYLYRQGLLQSSEVLELEGKYNIEIFYREEHEK